MGTNINGHDILCQTCRSSALDVLQVASPRHGDAGIKFRCRDCSRVQILSIVDGDDLAKAEAKWMS